MINSEKILQNILFPGKTQQVLQLVEEIHQVQATLQEKLFELDSIVNGGGTVRKLPEIAKKLLSASAEKKQISRKKPSERVDRDRRDHIQAKAKKKTLPKADERVRRVFTSEFKAKVVSAVLNDRQGVGAAAKKFSVGESNLREWIQIAVAKAQRSKQPIPQDLQDKFGLSSYLNAACEQTMSILKVAKVPLPSSKMRLKGYKRATLYRALAFLKEIGDVTSSGKGRGIVYAASKGKESKSSNGVHVN